MNMREKVLMGAVVLALLYAGYEFFLKKEAAEPWEPGAEAAEKVLADFAGQVKNGEKEALYAGLLRAASSGWDMDPFAGDLPPEKEEESVSPESPSYQDWIYMGYMALGNLRMAVISGIEYGEGEMLAGKENLKIVKIHEDWVMLEDGEKRQVILERSGGDSW